MEECEFNFATDEFGGGVAVDAGKVGAAGVGAGGRGGGIERRGEGLVAVVEADSLVDFFHNVRRRERDDVEVAVAWQDAECGQIAGIAEAEEHEAVRVGGGDELAEVPPFETAPALGGVGGAEEEDEEFGVFAVEAREVNVEIEAGEFGVVEAVVEDVGRAEAVGEE